MLSFDSYSFDDDVDRQTFLIQKICSDNLEHVAKSEKSAAEAREATVLT